MTFNSTFAFLIFVFSAIPAHALEKVVVGSSPVVSSAGLYLAQEKGFFREQGLEVEITDIASSGAPMTLLLQKGELDVAAGNLTAGLFKAIAQSAEKSASSKLVADKGHISKETDYIVLLVRKDHLDSGRYKSLKDLKGFKLGLTSMDGVSQEILTDRFLAKASLSEKDIEYVKLTYAEMNTALKTKNIDATIQLEPYVAQAELGGFAKVAARGSEVYPGQQSAALMYSAKFLANRERAVRFMIGYLKGVRLYNKSLKSSADKEVSQILEKRFGIKEEVWSKMVPVGIEDSGRLNLTSLKDDLRWYRKNNFLTTDVSVESVVDTSFAEEAVKRLDAK